MEAPNYGVLGLSQSADFAAARKAFLKLALAVHPDKQGQEGVELPSELRAVDPKQRFNALTEALLSFKNGTKLPFSNWVNAVPVIVDRLSGVQDVTAENGASLLQLEETLWALVCRCGSEEFIDLKELEGGCRRRVSCTGCSQKYSVVFV